MFTLQKNKKRQSTKKMWANRWDYNASGVVSKGEELFQAAERELLEETGLLIDLRDIPSRLTVSFEEGWNEIYFITKNVALEDLNLQEEVSEMNWVTESEYLNMLSKNEFIPYIYAKSIYDFYRSQNESLY
ncbi:NUDIX domain-containing protein [Enterococcus silesiacus]